MEKLNVGVIGLGLRGASLLENVILPLAEERLNIVGLCDVGEDKVNKCADMVLEKTGKKPFCTTNYHEILDLDIKAVFVLSSWETHFQVAIDAMNAGKHVGLEVGGAFCIDECWELVKTSEKTGKHCMLLENCCYGERELMVLNMVRQGVFGEIVHCAGGYHHDLRKQVSYGNDTNHYRLKHYLNRNGENYPTHELGPIAKVLNINRGNRMLTLSSFASKSAGLHEYIVKNRGENDDLAKVHFNQGDIVTTIIKCANGETIKLTLDTTLPRAYCRGFTVRGTKGSYFEENDSIFLDGVHDEFDAEWKKIWGNAEQYKEEYSHPLWKEGCDFGGHGGMDGLVFTAFVDSCQRDIEPPIDVYDAAAWMVITVLSEQSIAMGGAPVAIPDFTRGQWMIRKNEHISDFSL